MKIAPLGGLGEIGLNAMVFEHEGRRLLVDCGLMFPRGDVPGVEVVMPDLGWLFEQPDLLDGVVLTHAHEDHVGALPALLRRVKVPVYGTKFTLGVARHRLEEVGLGNTELRPIGPRSPETIGAFTVEPLRMTHSIPDAIGLAIGAGGITAVHTGDFKLDLEPIDGQLTDLERLGELGERGVDLLLSDSTNAEVPGVTRSERVVEATFMRLFPQAPGRIIVSVFGSHLHRVQHTLTTAEKLGRKVLVWGRSLERNVRIARDLGYLKVNDDTLVDLQGFLALPREKALLICTGAQGEPRSALVTMVSDEPRELRVLAGDTVILSSRTIPGNEPLVTDLIDRAYARGATVIWPALEPGVHVSGHGARDEQKKLIQVARPKMFVPIHGELHHLHHHIGLAREAGLEPHQARLATDGDLLELDEQGLTTLGRIPVGRLFGRRESDAYVSGRAIDERRNLGHGVVFAAVALEAGSGRVVAGPRLTSRGLPSDEDALLPLAAQAARANLLELSEILRGDDALVVEQVTAGIRRVFKQAAGRRPTVVVQVLRV
ncbi:MAG: ribonuclease J [Myxococcaceae bacterium]|nr:ribonuclease J [Myxococcaceae bacterium]